MKWNFVGTTLVLCYEARVHPILTVGEARPEALTASSSSKYLAASGVLAASSSSKYLAASEVLAPVQCAHLYKSEISHPEEKNEKK